MKTKSQPQFPAKAIRKKPRYKMVDPVFNLMTPEERRVAEAFFATPPSPDWPATPMQKRMQGSGPFFDTPITPVVKGE